MSIIKPQESIKLQAPFRREHYRHLLRKLLDRGDVQFITYNDLAWQQSDDHRVGYPAEWSAWNRELASGKRDKKNVYILIQHDADSGPTQTIDMMNLEAQYGIVSSAMIFRRWRGDSFGDTLNDYPIDYERLQTFEKMGFVIGYHCNAFQNAGFDSETVFSLFLEDVSLLRKQFNIKYFSPHGGQTRDGLGNASFDYLSATRIDLKHVHNSASPRFSSTYTDGGLFKRLLDRPNELDFIAWCDQLTPGRRYRMLIHPQYWSDENFVINNLFRANWYRRLINLPLLNQ